MRRLFDIVWPATLPSADCVDGVPVSRFRALRLPDAAGALVNRLVMRAWRRVEAELDGSTPTPEDLVDVAPHWGRSADRLAQLGRGPAAPTLLASVARRASHSDIVLVGHAPFGLMAWVEMTARRSGKPVVLLPFIHECDPFHHLPSLHRAYERAGAVLTLSPHTAGLLRRVLPASNPIAIGAGVDLSVFDAPRVSGERFRARHGLQGRRLLLFVGRKERGKRYDLALDAAGADDATLVMIGRDVDRARLPRGVLHLEYLEPRDLADAYDACDVLLHPSEQESFGMVCLEAWLRRKPVIANARCGASASLISDGRDGMLCEREDDWRRTVRRLATDPELARRMGEEGRAKVLSTYTWEHAGRRALALYENLVESR
jgi:glycosyltransferase involved in cell wall biosynthesis